MNPARMTAYQAFDITEPKAAVSREYRIAALGRAHQ